MAIDVLEKPAAPPARHTRHSTTIHETHKSQPEIYQGNTNKMDVFNNGEDGHDRAVSFQLKKGTQGLAFVLGTDSRDSKRVINLDTSDKLSEMTDKEYTETAILQQQEDSLSVLTPDGQDVRLTQEGLKGHPYTVKLNGSTNVEILDFDPKENSIVLHKINREILLITPLAPLPPVPLPWWKSRIMDFVAPIVVTAAIGGGAIGGIYETPLPPSPPQIERQAETQIPETLKCPATIEMTVAPGDSLTKLLVDVNGLPRYLTPEGKLDIQKLYKDLACTLVIPENRGRIRGTDPLVADMLDTAFQGRTLIGPVTAEMIRELINHLNDVRSKNLPPGADPQLVIIQPDQKVLISDFRTQQSPNKMPQSSIPAPDLSTIASR